MKSFLIQLAIRFLLRRLVPGEFVGKLESLVETAEHQKLDDKAKFDFVRNAAVKAVVGRAGGNQLNTAIELVLLARKLRKT
jgi:hypothetical protein